MDKAQNLKKDLVRLLDSARASRIRTIIVSDEVWKQLNGGAEFKGQIAVSGVKGNLWLRYSFTVLRHPNFHTIFNKQGYFFVAHPAATYEEIYLGRENEYLGSNGHNKRRVDKDLRLQELHPISGVLEQRQGGGCQVYHDIPFDEAVQILRTTPDSRAVRTAVLNPPEIRWTGSRDIYLRQIEKVRYCNHPFLHHIGFPEPNLGHLYMKKWDRQWRIGVQAIDGFWKRRQITMFGPYSSVTDFAAQALKFFHPEEVWFALFLFGANEFSLSELESKAATPNWLDRWHDPDELGRIENWSDKPYIHVVDTAGLGSFLPFEGDITTLFPEDWKGWPSTKADTAFSHMASTLFA